jgi:peptide deformylase
MVLCSIGFAATQVLAEYRDESEIEAMLVMSPHPALRQMAVPIDRDDTETIALLEDMADYLDDSVMPKGGLSLPQVGVSKRGFVVLVEDEPVVMMNPRVSVEGLQVASLEGCLSIPDTYGYVYRWEDITIKYYDENWRYQSVNLDDIEAFSVQHENDHLNGVLIADKFLPNKYNNPEKNVRMLD